MMDSRSAMTSLAAVSSVVVDSREEEVDASRAEVLVRLDFSVAIVSASVMEPRTEELGVEVVARRRWAGGGG